MAELLSGIGGRAWPFERQPETSDQQGTLAAWIVEAPWARPFWSQYLLALIHLRPIEGVRQAWREDPRATHEVMLYALNPEHLRKPEDDPQGPLYYLTPANFVGQFAADSDEAAAAAACCAVADILAGTLSPDTDCRAQWKARFPFHGYGRQVGHA